MKNLLATIRGIAKNAPLITPTVELLNNQNTPKGVDKPHNKYSIIANYIMGGLLVVAIWQGWVSFDQGWSELGEIVRAVLENLK